MTKLSYDDARHAVRAVAGTDAGQKLLALLCQSSGYLTPTDIVTMRDGSTDVNQTMHRMGRRSLYLAFRKFLPNEIAVKVENMAESLILMETKVKGEDDGSNNTPAVPAVSLDPDDYYPR